MGLYSGPVLLSVLRGAVEATELSGPRKNSLGEGNMVLQLQNGQLIWTDIWQRARRGEGRSDWIEE